MHDLVIFRKIYNLPKSPKSDRLAKIKHFALINYLERVDAIIIYKA
jgi:hypothetical protein